VCFKQGIHSVLSSTPTTHPHTHHRSRMPIDCTWVYIEGAMGYRSRRPTGWTKTRVPKILDGADKAFYLYNFHLKVGSSPAPLLETPNHFKGYSKNILKALKLLRMDILFYALLIYVDYYYYHHHNYYTTIIIIVIKSCHNLIRECWNVVANS
jgi:hypothetical protein